MPKGWIKKQEFHKNIRIEKEDIWISQYTNETSSMQTKLWTYANSSKFP